MQKNAVINEKYKEKEKLLNAIIFNFANTGQLFNDGPRNKIKLFQLNDETVNVKSFKIPNFINKVAYKYFRKSKAKRSFEFAEILESKGIGTPKPIAFFEFFNFFGLKNSYYVSEQLICDFTFRELVLNPNFQDYENILRQFTQFTFDLHQNGIEFKDHSPGNTLIKKVSEHDYHFFLVDLNRMNFHDNFPLELRMKNFSRLSPQREMIEIMSDEYAKCLGVDSDEIFKLMWHFTEKFFQKNNRKQQLKKRFNWLK